MATILYKTIFVILSLLLLTEISAAKNGTKTKDRQTSEKAKPPKPSYHILAVTYCFRGHFNPTAGQLNSNQKFQLRFDTKKISRCGASPDEERSQGSNVHNKQLPPVCS